MTDIQRYTTAQNYKSRETCMVKQDAGEWVKHEDHIKAMENKEDVINSLWETFITIAKKLDINLEKAKNHEGNPSDVFIEYIEAQAKEIERLKEQIDDLKDACQRWIKSNNHNADTIAEQAKEIEWLKGEEDKFKTLLMHIENYYPEEYESLMGMLPC